VCKARLESTRPLLLHRVRIKKNDEDEDESEEAEEEEIKLRCRMLGAEEWGYWNDTFEIWEDRNMELDSGGGVAVERRENAGNDMTGGNSRGREEGGAMYIFYCTIVFLLNISGMH
jgi:hypothetical protein